MPNDSVIETDFQEKHEFVFSTISGDIADAKREAFHKVVVALYLARSKGMGVDAFIHALRDFNAESTDDIGLAISEFDPAQWGYLG